MEDWSLEVTKDFDGTEKLIQIVGQARFGVSILGVWKQLNLRLFSLRLLRQSGIDVEEAVPHEPADSRHHSEEDEKEGGEVHGEGQAQGEESKQPCRKGDGGECDEPEEKAGDGS